MAGDLAVVPVHPESLPDDPRTLRWVIPAGTLGFVGMPVEVPAPLRQLLDDATLAGLTVEPAAVRLTLAAGLEWREQGVRVRDALQAALAVPEQWQAPDLADATDAMAAMAAPGDDVLRAAVHQVLDGEVGDYIRSHGGQVILLSAHESEVEVQLSGACRHCPASDVTLTERLEGGVRALYPGVLRLTARDEPGPGAGRRMLRLIPTRGR